MTVLLWLGVRSQSGALQKQGATPVLSGFRFGGLWGSLVPYTLSPKTSGLCEDPKTLSPYRPAASKYKSAQLVAFNINTFPVTYANGSQMYLGLNNTAQDMTVRLQLLNIAMGNAYNSSLWKNDSSVLKVRTHVEDAQSVCTYAAGSPPVIIMLHQ